MSHNHCGHVCQHNNLKYCKHCQVPYCVDCGYEWKTYNWNPYYWYTTTGVPVDISPTIACNTNTFPTNCNHTE